MKNNINNQLIDSLTRACKQDGIQKVVVGAVIFAGEKVLLLRRNANDFLGGLVELPSGGLENGEDILSALAREVQEETGLKITSVNGYVGHFDYLSGSGKRSRQLNFLVSTEGTVLLNPQEHDQYFWLSLKDQDFNSINISEKTMGVISGSFRLMK